MYYLRDLLVGLYSGFISHTGFHRALSVCSCAINRRVAQTLQVRFRKIRGTGIVYGPEKELVKLWNHPEHIVHILSYLQ